MNEMTEKLAHEFSDAEYAHTYMESHAVSRLAAQIYALRKQRNWSQEELSMRSGVAQERISKIESADFDSLTMKTLQKFSHAFDVNLSISFQSFSEGILDLVNLNSKKLEVDSREEDLQKFKVDPLKIDIDGDLYKVDAKRLGVVKTLSANKISLPIPNLNGWHQLGQYKNG